MRKIKNPFVVTKDYFCFGCSHENTNGLKMDFFEDGDEIISEWQPTKHFQGYVNILHGGIQSALIDEVAYWTVLIKLKTAGVTAKLDVHLKKPVFMDKGKISLRANIVEVKRKIAHIAVKLFDADNNICAVAKVYYYIFPLEESIRNYNYPKEYSSFFE